MRQKIFTICLFSTFLFLFSTISAHATEYTDWEDVPTDISQNMTLDFSGIEDSPAANKTLTVAAGKQVTVIGNADFTFNKLQIVIEDGVELTIKDLKIDNNGASGISAIALSPDATATLFLESSNDIRGAANLPALSIPDGTDLTITSVSNGYLKAGGAGQMAAAIGGAAAQNSGHIRINGNAAVDALATALGAAIGGGAATDAAQKAGDGIVTISGNAVVNAKSSGPYDPALIGGGAAGAGSRAGQKGGDGIITITENAVVTATAENNIGSVIGGGGNNMGDDGRGGDANVTISGNAVVTASNTGDFSYGTAIGNGYGNTASGNAVVTISGNASVTATLGRPGCPAIGGNGDFFKYGKANITISGGMVNASAIGGGGGSTITITGGSVKTDSGAFIGASPLNAYNAALTLKSKNYSGLTDRTLAFTADDGANPAYEYSFRVPKDDTAYLWLPAAVSAPEADDYANASVTLAASLINNNGSLAVALAASVSGDASPDIWQRFDISGDIDVSGNFSGDTALDTEVLSGDTYGYRARAALPVEGAFVYSDMLWLPIQVAEINDIILNVPESGTIRLNPDGTFQIEFTTDPADALQPIPVYSSSNEDVAVVSATGLVTAVGDGTATITVTVTTFDGRTITKTFAVSVETFVTEINDIILNVPVGGTIELAPDGTFQIEFTTDPANALQPIPVYSSSNEDVAIVSATGLVTAVGNGTATITVTVITHDGRTITKTFTVSVGTFKKHKGSSGCAAAGFGIILLALLPMLYRRTGR